MDAATTSTAPVTLTLVHSAGCHFCEDARVVLDDLAAVYPISVERLPAEDPAGAVLIVEHRVGMFPLVLVDGRFFSAGRLPRRKLQRLLAERFAWAVA